MPASDTKIITKLHERRQIEADLRRMLALTSEQEYRERARQIAALGSQVIPTIVGNLEQASAPLLMALGIVSTFLDRDEVARALRDAVHHPHRSDQARLAAMTILSRFLDQPTEDLLPRLSDPEKVAFASLQEVLRQAQRNPAVLVGYIEALDRQDPDLVLAVVRYLGDASTPLAIEPLRLMAQDVREEIAAEALQALGRARLPEAVWALQTLVPTAAPALRPSAERLLRKLQFAGVSSQPLPQPAPDWRALVGAPDGLGRQSVWFIQGTDQAPQTRFLNVLLIDTAGAVEAVGHSQVSTHLLPPQRPPGHVHDMVLPDGSGAVLMVECSFDAGRRLVVDAIAQNRETQIPVAGALRLLAPWLWGYSIEGALPPRRSLQRAHEDAALVALSDRLVTHPAFATWTACSPGALRAASENVRCAAWDLTGCARRVAGELFSEQPLVVALRRRLEAMSEWFLWAGEETWARLSLVAAETLAQQRPQEHPFVLALLRRDLELMLHTVEDSPGRVLNAELDKGGR